MTPDRDTPRSLGGRIRQARKRRQMTQTQLAAKAGIGQSALSSLETDDSRAPHAGTLLRLAAALEVDPYWLQTGSGSSEPPRVPDDWVASIDVLSPANRHAVELMVRALIADQVTTRPSDADPFPNVPAPVRRVRKARP